MQKLNVAVLCGGYTAERNISLGSGEVVAAQIDPEKYNVYKVLVDTDGFFLEDGHIRVELNDFSVHTPSGKVQFDIAFNAIHGSPGEDGLLQGYFEMLGIPHTSCSAACASLTFNKAYTKKVLDGMVPMANGLVLEKNSAHNEAALDGFLQTVQFPLFVKPNNNGSSYGISKVHTQSDLQSAIDEAFRYDSEVLIEEGIQGTEVTCGVYMYHGAVIVLPLCLVAVSNHEFFNYTAKYISGESDEIIPAPIEESVAEKVRALSARIYSHLHCRGVVRMDYIIRDGIPHFLEVNTVPGISAASIVPKMAKVAGMTLTEFFGRLLEEAWTGKGH